MRRTERDAEKRRISRGKRMRRMQGDASPASHKHKKKIPAAVAVLLCVAGAAMLVAGGFYGTQFYRSLIHAPEATRPPVETAEPAPTETPAPMEEMPVIGSNRPVLQEPTVTPQPEIVRNLSRGAANLRIDQRHINQPTICGNEIFYSAGSGALDSAILTKLCIYNLETQTEETIKTTNLYNGSFYETLINEKWLVWLETDHGIKNYICVRNRETGEDSVLKTCENGKPKLRLSGDTLIWMEQTEETLDRLYMIDLVSQENIALFSFEDVATYGVSAPYIRGDYITWSGPDPEQTPEDRAIAETSGIFWVNLGTDVGGEEIVTNVYRPGTYVHEPHFDGENFIWIDSNKSFHSNLYYAPLGGEAEIIATGVTTYALGDGIVVYGKDQAVWVYVIETGETCRLTSDGETGIMPSVEGTTVVWDTTSVDGDRHDVVRYKVLTVEELYPLGRREEGSKVEPTPIPTAAPTADPNATPAPDATPAPESADAPEAPEQTDPEADNGGE